MNFLLTAAAVFEDIAAKRKCDIADVIGIVRDVKEREAELNHSRRSEPAEKELVLAELPKLPFNAEALSHMTARQLHAELVKTHPALRMNQGVLSVISRARKQALLTKQAA